MEQKRTLRNRVWEFRASRAIDINRFLSLGIVTFDLCAVGLCAFSRCLVGAYLVGVFARRVCSSRSVNDGERKG